MGFLRVCASSRLKQTQSFLPNSALKYSCPSRDDAKNNNPIVKLVQMSVQPGKGGEMPTLEDDLEADLLLALEAEASSEEVKYAVIAFYTTLNLKQK